MAHIIVHIIRHQTCSSSSVTVGSCLMLSSDVTCWEQSRAHVMVITTAVTLLNVAIAVPHTASLSLVTGTLVNDFMTLINVIFIGLNTNNNVVRAA